MWETWVWFLFWEYPLEEGMATHSSILAWRIPWIEDPGGLQSMSSQRVGHDEQLNTAQLTLCVSQISKVAINSLVRLLSQFPPVCCSIFYSNCCFLVCIQISHRTGKVVWYSNLFKNFWEFVVIHTVKDFSIVHKAEVDVFVEFPSFWIYDLMNIGNLASCSSAFYKHRLYIWKFFHIVLKVTAAAK